MKRIIFTVSFVSLLPLIALAQGPLNSVTDADSLITKISDLVNATVWLFISLAVLFIIWNALQFIRQTDSAERSKYQSTILWGIVGLFIILSIWGLVNILDNTFNVGNFQGQGNASNNINSLIPTRATRTPTPGGSSNLTPAPLTAPTNIPAGNPPLNTSPAGTAPAQTTNPAPAPTSPSSTWVPSATPYVAPANPPAPTNSNGYWNEFNEWVPRQ